LRKEDFEFIGVKSYKDEAEREKILNSYDKYQISKLEFLNLYYDNAWTRLTYFRNYNNNIHAYEVAKNKDLMKFSPDEAEAIIKSCVWAVESTLTGLFIFGKKYCSWCKNVLKLVDINPFDLLIINEVTKNSKAKLQRKIVPLKIFYKQCNQMLKEGIPIEFVMIVICIRYGIAGDQLLQVRNLKWSNIDFENKMVLIENDNGKIITRVPIDDDFIFWLNSINHLPTDVYVVGSNHGHGKPLQYASIYSRIRKSYEKIDAVQQGIKDPLFNRQFELLLLLREKRQLYDYDIKRLVERFYGRRLANNSKSQINSILDRYEILTDDLILRTSTTGLYKKIRVTNPESICKEDSKKVIRRILDDLKFELPKDMDIESFMAEDITVDEESNELENKDIKEINGLKVDSDGVILEEVSATATQEDDTVIELDETLDTDNDND
jgi:integrase